MRRSWLVVLLIAVSSCRAPAQPVAAVVAQTGHILACVRADTLLAVPCPPSVTFYRLHAVANGPMKWETGTGEVECVAPLPRLLKPTNVRTLEDGRAIALGESDTALRQRIWQAAAGQGPFTGRQPDEAARLLYAFALDLDGDGRDEILFELEERTDLILPDVGPVQSYVVAAGVIPGGASKAALFAKDSGGIRLNDALVGLAALGNQSIGLVFANVDGASILKFDGRALLALDAANAFCRPNT